jgi:hypothetical protein
MDERAVDTLQAPDDGASVLLAQPETHGEAIVIRQLLASYDIPCTVQSDLPHSLMPTFGPAGGGFTVWIPAARFDEADQLLAEHRRHSFRLIRGGRRR